MEKLIVGCGYLGMRVAAHWLQQGDRVFAVTRSPDTARGFSARGIQPIVADVTEPNSLADLPRVHTVLYSVGFDRGHEATMEQVYVAGLANVLAALENAVDRFVYISSTGVYGQADGSWVTEESPCEPIRHGGQVCLAAERTLAADPLGKRSVILRLAGIYGPGRVPRRDKLKENASIPVPAGFLNLIHVDDAVLAVLAAERCSTFGGPLPRTYIVSDGNPVERREYYRELARLLGLNSITFRDAEPDTAVADRALGNKRVRNTRLRDELAVQPRYATYREGLSAVLATA